MLHANRLTVSTEEIFYEPVSAATLAGVIKLLNEKFFSPGMNVVCTLTGSGFKDPDAVFRVAQEPTKVDAEVRAVEKALEGIL